MFPAVTLLEVFLLGFFSLIYLLNKYLLKAYHVPDTGYTAGNKADQVLYFVDFIFWENKNKQIYNIKLGGN